MGRCMTSGFYVDDIWKKVDVIFDFDALIEFNV